MSRQRKQKESDEAPGAPEWMVTFSDCMTLLLTFFVLLLSFSSFDNRVFPELRIIYSEALTNITATPQLRQRDALVYFSPIKYITKLEKGSEKPTVAKELKEALMKEAGFADLDSSIVFLIPSKKIFWGRGTILSAEGRRIMNLMGSFLNLVPGRVVVSENGSTDVQDNQNFGLPRAWEVMKYLTTRQGLAKDRFSISATGTVVQGSSNRETLRSKRQVHERMVEIILLERRTYN